jgi:hypothetical protein
LHRSTGPHSTTRIARAPGRASPYTTATLVVASRENERRPAGVENQNSSGPPRAAYGTALAEAERTRSAIGVVLGLREWFRTFPGAKAARGRAPQAARALERSQRGRGRASARRGGAAGTYQESPVLACTSRLRYNRVETLRALIAGVGAVVEQCASERGAGRPMFPVDGSREGKRESAADRRTLTPPDATLCDWH